MEELSISARFMSSISDTIPSLKSHSSRGVIWRGGGGGGAANCVVYAAVIVIPGSRLRVCVANVSKLCHLIAVKAPAAVVAVSAGGIDAMHAQGCC